MKLPVFSTEEAPTDLSQWHRVHPVTPFLSGGPVFLALLGFLMARYGPAWFNDISNEVSGTGELFDNVSAWLALLGFIGVLLLLVGFQVLSWRQRQYRVDQEAFYQRRGILFKQHLQARLDRIQSVEIVQPLLARIFGFAKLRIEVPGGLNSAQELEYLRLHHAQALRNEVIARITRVRAERDQSVSQPVAAADAPLAGDVAGTAVGEVTESPKTSAPAAEFPMYRVPAKHLIASIFLSLPAVILIATPIVLLVLGLIFKVALPVDFLAVFGVSAVTAIYGFFGMLAYFWSVLNSRFNFRAAISSEGIRISHGLTQTRRQTVVPGRVQAVSFTQPILWRKPDWWKVQMNVAGEVSVDDGSTQAGRGLLLPVGTRQEALTALWMAIPDLGDPDPASLVGTALSGRGADNGFATVPPRARWLDPWQWRNRGVRATDRALFIRSGFLMRHLVVVPHEKVQSMCLVQGPITRLLGLASVEVHSTPGQIKPVVKHMDLSAAQALIAEQAVRSQQRRRQASLMEWQKTMGLV